MTREEPDDYEKKKEKKKRGAWKREKMETKDAKKGEEHTRKEM